MNVKSEIYFLDTLGSLHLGKKSSKYVAFEEVDFLWNRTVDSLFKRKSTSSNVTTE